MLPHKGPNGVLILIFIKLGFRAWFQRLYERFLHLSFLVNTDAVPTYALAIIYLNAALSPSVPSQCFKCLL